MRRFFAPQKLAVGQSAVLSGSDAAHISRVLRLKTGDVIAVFDGKGHAYECRLETVAPDGVTVTVVKAIPSRAEPGVHITFAQAMLKSKKMDTLIRMATELGISRWVPFFSERSVPTPDKKPMAARLDRWNKISREALKQCGRERFMDISAPVAMNEMLAMGRSCDRKIIFWECESGAEGQVVPAPEGSVERVIVVVGPEGGFSAGEVEKAKSLGYATASLGPRILKADTAAIAAAVLMQFRFGDMA